MLSTAESILEDVLGDKIPFLVSPMGSGKTTAFITALA